MRSENYFFKGVGLIKILKKGTLLKHEYILEHTLLTVGHFKQFLFLFRIPSFQEKSRMRTKASIVAVTT